MILLEAIKIALSEVGIEAMEWTQNPCHEIDLDGNVVYSSLHVRVRMPLNNLAYRNIVIGAYGHVATVKYNNYITYFDLRVPDSLDELVERVVQLHESCNTR